MIYFGRSKIEIPKITIEDEPIDRAENGKLLGVNINYKLTWDEHVNTIYKKASKRLYYLRQLKQAGLGIKDLMQVYISIIRPVLEYACPAWSTSLTVTSNDLLESIQKRAMKVIKPSCTYLEALHSLNIPSLKERRDTLCRTFFKDNVINPEGRLHNLLPPRRETGHNLRASGNYPLPKVKTNRCKSSFINWGLFHCQ